MSVGVGPYASGQPILHMTGVDGQHANVGDAPGAIDLL
jgi:hypothetical protein